MIKYNGFFYLVSVNGVEYAVKFNHLEEFVALHRGDGAVVISAIVKSQIQFDNGYQWYKKI